MSSSAGQNGLMHARHGSEPGWLKFMQPVEKQGSIEAWRANNPCTADERSKKNTYQAGGMEQWHHVQTQVTFLQFEGHLIIPRHGADVLMGQGNDFRSRRCPRRVENHRDVIRPSSRCLSGGRPSGAVKL